MFRIFLSKPVVYSSATEMEIIYNDISLFWKTIIEFYNENIYYLDEDGYLFYDFNKGGEVGRRYNVEISY